MNSWFNLDWHSLSTMCRITIYMPICLLSWVVFCLVGSKPIHKYIVVNVEVMCEVLDGLCCLTFVVFWLNTTFWRLLIYWMTFYVWISVESSLSSMRQSRLALELGGVFLQAYDLFSTSSTVSGFYSYGPRCNSLVGVLVFLKKKKIVMKIMLLTQLYC